MGHDRAWARHAVLAIVDWTWRGQRGAEVKRERSAGRALPAPLVSGNRGGRLVRQREMHEGRERRRMAPELWAPCIAQMHTFNTTTGRLVGENLSSAAHPDPGPVSKNPRLRG